MDYTDDGLFEVATDISTTIKTPVKSRPIGNEYIININRDMMDLVTWQDELDTLRDATENDQITIRYNSPGGDLYIATEFISAQSNCRAHITAELTGRADSAASISFMYCDSYIVHPFTRMLIHTCSYGTSGNSHENWVEAEATKGQMKEIIECSYDSFLTEDEIERVLRGETFTLLWKEIIERLEFRQELRELEEDETDSSE